MKKLLLWLSLAWSVLRFLLGLMVLGAGADLESIELRHEIRQLLAVAPEAAVKLAFHDAHWRMLNRVAVSLMITGVVLCLAAVIGLRALRAPRRHGG